MTPDLPSGAPLAIREWIAASLILLFVGGVSLASARHQSITTDEIVHIPAGITYLQLHDARMNPEHPPLIKVLAALPLVLSGVRLDYSLPHWRQTKDALFGEEAFSQLGPPSARWIFASRAAMLPVLLALGFSIFWMARRIAGPTGGLLSLLVFATTPFFYAYGSLVLTDIGIALFALLSIWTFASFWTTPDWSQTIRFSISFAAALLTKFTAGLLLPSFLLTGLWLALRSPAPRALRTRLLRFSIAVAIASVAVYFVYFFLFWNNDTAAVLSYRFEHSVAPIPAMHKVAEYLHSHQSLQHLLSPPITYFLGVGHTLHALPRTTYLLGKTYVHGTSLYFPVLFLCKMPLGYHFLVVLLGFLLVLRLGGRPRQAADASVSGAPDHLRALLVLFTLFACASVASPLNIGIRHFSVPIAVLTVLLALIAPLAARASRPALRTIVPGTVAVALLSSLIATASAYPNFIPYFNPLIAQRPKFDIAIDSNLDWGQSLVSLEQFKKQHPAESLAFDVKGSIAAVYLPDGVRFNCESGVPDGFEWVAIGASRFINQPELPVSSLPPPPQCRSFFSYPYEVKAGGSVYIFHLARQDAQR